MPLVFLWRVFFSVVDGFSFLETLLESAVSPVTTVCLITVFRRGNHRPRHATDS